MRMFTGRDSASPPDLNTPLGTPKPSPPPKNSPTPPPQTFPPAVLPGLRGGRVARLGALPPAELRAPARPRSPLGHLSELRPLEVGGQAPDLLPGGRHGRAPLPRRPSRASYGQPARTNLLAATPLPRPPTAPPPGPAAPGLRGYIYFYFFNFYFSFIYFYF